MSSIQRPRARRLKRGTKTEEYLAALSGEDGASTSASSSKQHQQEPAISSMDSPFEVQEYLAMLVAENPHDIQRLVQIPRWKRNSAATSDSDSDMLRSKDKGKQAAISNSDNQDASSADLDGDDDRASKGQSSSNDNSTRDGTEEGDSDEYEYVDRDVWLYEHLRRLAIDLSQPFVVTLQDHCSRETCPEMKAGEWLYLCAAHATANETECCAIDYITHTLDGATALLNSSRYFPSRINIPPTSLKHFTSIARRLYRIFAHAWYHHRELFDICESSTSLYERFLALSIEYDLVPRELLTIPSQHEQLSEQDPTSSSSAPDNNENHHDNTRDHRSNTIFSRGTGGPRMNGTTKEAQQEAKEEEEQNQIQRRILEKRVLGPGYTSSGGKQGDMNGSSSLGASNEDDEDDDDSSEESSDEESISMPPTASMAGLSLNASGNANASGNVGSETKEQKSEDDKTTGRLHQST